MSIHIEQWDVSYRRFQEQVTAFNEKIQSASLDKDELEKIYKIVKDEVKHLQEFANYASIREQELRQPGCCTPTRKAIWIVSGLNIASKIATLAAAILAALESTPEIKYSALACVGLSEICDCATTVYVTKSNFESDEIAKLSQLDQREVTNALEFKKFLKTLTKVRKLQENLIAETNKFAAYSIVEDTTKLDEPISKCLHHYDKLPASYRKDETYARVISLLIQRLPEDDPLKRALEDLEKKETDSSTTSHHSEEALLEKEEGAAEKREEKTAKSIPSYIPIRTKPQDSSDTLASASTSPRPTNWRNEQSIPDGSPRFRFAGFNGPNRAPHSKLASESLDRTTAALSKEEKFIKLNYLVKKRFHNAGAIHCFYTRDGHALPYEPYKMDKDLNRSSKLEDNKSRGPDLTEPEFASSNSQPLNAAEIIV